MAAGTPPEVAAAVRVSLSYVGLRSGWNNLCDRLACRAYGYANSGYPTAAAHWSTLVSAGRARPGDRCPPVGAFAYWATGRPAGHVALVVENTGGCDPERIKLVSNDALDNQHGSLGGVYLVTMRQIENGWMRAEDYRGWTDPICAGAQLPEGTRHPAR